MRAEIQGRPLVIFAAGLIVGVACLYSLWNLIFLCALFLLLGDSKSYKPAKPQWILIAGCALALLRTPVHAGPPVVDPMKFAGEATLLAMPQDGPQRQRALASTATGRVVLSLPKRIDASLGDTFWVAGDLRPLSEGSETHWRDDGANAELRAIGVEPISRGGWLFRQGLAMRRGFVGFVSENLDPKAAAVVEAVCFNQDNDLTPETMDNLRRTGTIHIISTSGLHVALLALFIYSVLGKLPIPRKVQVIALILLLFLYSAAAGFRPPAVRASVMAAIMGIAYFISREPDALSALAGSAVGVLVFAGTEQVLDVGFQISFLTVGCLVLALEYWREPPDGFWQLLAFRFKQAAVASAIAWFATIPLIAYHFGQISLVAFFANLAIGFVIPAIIAFSMSGWLAASLSATVGVGLMLPAQYLSGYLLAVVEALGPLRYSAVPTPPFSGYWLVAIYGVALLLWRPYARTAP